MEVFIKIKFAILATFSFRFAIFVPKPNGFRSKWAKKGLIFYSGNPGLISLVL